MSDFTNFGDDDAFDSEDVEELVLDFSEVKAASFETLPAGWYLCRITDNSRVFTKNPGKLPVGTPGINWEFTVLEPEEFENRRMWTNTWIHARTNGFLKTLATASGAFTAEQVEGQLSVGEIESQLIDRELYVQTRIRKSAQYGDQVDIRGYRPLSNPPNMNKGKGSTASGATSFMP